MGVRDGREPGWLLEGSISPGEAVNVSRRLCAVVLQQIPRRGARSGAELLLCRLQVLVQWLFCSQL